jgi:hypothetical protein
VSRPRLIRIVRLFGRFVALAYERERRNTDIC